ncbi:MAG: urea ABC transporter ATP-binding subunit UrtE [Oscillospiraceae bacterium]|nr:urea ABC transporter ATP-binding subunit UrtE [Oscillospiraceae bacterium]
MLELEHVTAAYNGSQVLFGVNIEAKVGDVTCLVGRNGVGKSTTLKSIMGLVPTPSGDIKLDGKSVFKMPPYARAKAGIGYVPQGREIFPQLSVKENILLGMEANRKIKTIPDYIFETFPILKEFLERRGGDLSGGQQQQLAIARAVVSRPKVLILDEPTEGIQPNVIQEIGRVITKLKSDMAILMVEQYLEFVLEVSDKCYVMEKGRISMSGPTETLDKRKLQTLLSM